MDQPLHNVINQKCSKHMKICDIVCTYINCRNKIICDRCVPDHVAAHPQELIYKVENLQETHRIDKVQKMRETLGANKMIHQTKIKKTYEKTKGLIDPLIKSFREFEENSYKRTKKQFMDYLHRNKEIIEETRIEKSDTQSLRKKPQDMINETLQETEIVAQRENLLKQNEEKFIWYTDAVDELMDSASLELKSMISVGLKLLANFDRIQKSRFTCTTIEDDHTKSFYMRYINSHQVAAKTESNNIEMDIIESKKDILAKDQEISRAHQEIKDKAKKIEELNNKIQGLKEALAHWEQKIEREEREKREAYEREKKKHEEHLIKKGVIHDSGRTISMEKKHMQTKYMQILIDLIPSPMQLILSRHYLTKPQLNMFLQYSSIQILTINFVRVDNEFLKQILSRCVEMHTLELNSANIENDFMGDLGSHLCDRLRNLQLIDNGIRDEGLEKMFRNMKSRKLQSLYVSYNELSHKSIETISKYCYDIKILHISKQRNPIKSLGVNLISRYLKDIEELFLGGTGVQKDGLFALCKNCLKIKKLNLVALELSIDIMAEILLSMEKLEWLDISYSKLNESDLLKINKLRTFNKDLDIICNI